MLKKNFMPKLERKKLDKSLHWTTFYSEKLLLAVIGALTMFAAGMDVLEMVMNMKVELGDLFLLFIYAEIIGMVGAFYISNRIPVTLPIIIAITALTRMIILQSKGLDAINIIYEASGILLLSVAAYIMSLKDKNSLSKLKIREEES